MEIPELNNVRLTATLQRASVEVGKPADCNRCKEVTQVSRR